MTTKLFYKIKPVKERIWRKVRKKYPKYNWNMLHSIFVDMAGKFNSVYEYTPEMKIERIAYDELIDLCVNNK